MNKIRLLPTHVIQTIAAGEIIERPAYVVKELIENSLDAGATNIDVSFIRSGLERIRINDNGEGIAKEDLPLAIEKHSTSKITSLTDLEKLASYGFRGEALASIVTVADLKLSSRRQTDDIGATLATYQGQAEPIIAEAMNYGTTVIVDHLFKHVPVRKKFLNNLHKERRLIIDVVTRLAIANPHVSFTLTGENKPIFNLAACGNMRDRINLIFDENITQHLIGVNYHHSFFDMEGMIGNNQIARRDNRHQYLFLNNRPINHQTIARIIKRAYGSLLESEDMPWFALNISLPSNIYDINVHPRKETVDFMDEIQVIKLVTDVIVDALTEIRSVKPSLPPFLNSNDDYALDKSTPLPELHQQLKAEVKPWSLKSAHQLEVLQVLNTYLVVKSEDGIKVFDQHAMHERILFEQFKNELLKSIDKIQTELESPITLNLNPSEKTLLTEHSQDLNKIGFNWIEFGPDSIQITSIPKHLENHNIAEILPKVLDDIAMGLPLNLSSETEKTLCYLACRSAVMAGEALSADEIYNLLQKWSETENNLSCPHGRPTVRDFSQEELEKMFERR